MNNIKKTFKFILGTLAAFSLTACGSSIDLIQSEELNTVNIQSAPFNSSSLLNLSLGKWGPMSLKFGPLLGDINGYEDEKMAVNTAIKLQKPLLQDSHDFTIVQGNNDKFFIYRINATQNVVKDLNDFNSYKDLRNSKIITSFNLDGNQAKVICLGSERGHLRFFRGEKTPVNYQLISTPYEAEKRLIDMEAALTRTQDHRGLFAAMYRVITQRGIVELENYRRQGNLKAAAFEEKLIINFANRYFEAYDNYAMNKMDGVTEVWKTAFDSGRKSQNLGLNKSANIAEVFALSMNAHIIHDLPFTLKEIGYNVNDRDMKATFDRFNTVLFEEKNNILAAVKNGYGNNIVQKASDFFGSPGNLGMQKIFAVMREIASNKAAYHNQENIVKTAITFADLILKIIPGGNGSNTVNSSKN